MRILGGRGRCAPKRIADRIGGRIANRATDWQSRRGGSGALLRLEVFAVLLDLFELAVGLVVRDAAPAGGFPDGLCAAGDRRVERLGCKRERASRLTVEAEPHRGGVAGKVCEVVRGDLGARLALKRSRVAAR